MTERFIKELEIKLKGNLPGKEAQEIMAPTVRFQGNKFPNPDLSKPSGVLILLFPSVGDWSTVFIKRTSFGLHGGQISLPGGKMEDNDIDIKATALREAMEEIGSDPFKIKVIGQLTPLHVPHSNFRITPFVGFLEEVPVLQQNEREVQAIIRIRLTELFDMKNRGIKTFNRSGNTIQAPYYNAKGHVVWGATAMIISEFEALVE